MKKVLIISYYWPPAGGPGVQRVLKFVKYLRTYNWEPIIITPQNGSYSSLDDTLSNDIPTGIEVCRTKTFEPFLWYNILQGKKSRSISVGMIGLKESNSLFQKAAKYIRANYFIPDARIGWNRYALKAAKKIVKQQKIDAILTTGPPHSSHLVGLKLKKRFKIPWLADLRDPWTTVYYNALFPRTASTRKKDRLLEREVVSTADQVTVISNGLKKEFESQTKAIEVIYNGFDEDDIYKGEEKKTRQFFLAYTGNLKPNQNINTLWQALKELKEEKHGFKERFRLRLIGNITPSVISSIQEHGIEDLVQAQGYVSHYEATKIMFESNLLLFIVPRSPNNDLILTGKIFEYLASRTPLLSIGPEWGDAAKLLAENDRDKMIGYENKQRIKDTVLNHYNLWETNDSTSSKHDENSSYQKYSRKNLTGQLATILNRISG